MYNLKLKNLVYAFVKMGGLSTRNQQDLKRKLYFGQIGKKYLFCLIFPTFPNFYWFHVLALEIRERRFIGEGGVLFWIWRVTVQVIGVFPESVFSKHRLRQRIFSIINCP